MIEKINLETDDDDPFLFIHHSPALRVLCDESLSSICLVLLDSTPCLCLLACLLLLLLIMKMIEERRKIQSLLLCSPSSACLIDGTLVHCTSTSMDDEMSSLCDNRPSGADARKRGRERDEKASVIEVGKLRNILSAHDNRLEMHERSRS